MATIHSFSAVSDAQARILILGSMPGKRSLDDNQYYAHPRNSFWPIISTLLGFSLTGGEPVNYTQRLNAVRHAKIALWDVLQACDRESSLDADIVESSIVVNDFAGFFNKHKNISHIFFNGAKAQQLYQRHVLPMLDEGTASMLSSRLPSTSPAHAALSFEQKLAEWRVVLEA